MQQLVVFSTIIRSDVTTGGVFYCCQARHDTSVFCTVVRSDVTPDGIYLQLLGKMRHLVEFLTVIRPDVTIGGVFNRH